MAVTLTRVHDHRGVDVQVYWSIAGSKMMRVFQGRDLEHSSHGFRLSMNAPSQFHKIQYNLYDVTPNKDKNVACRGGKA